MTILALGLRTYGRYALPLTLLAAIALAPLAGIALTIPAPIDATAIRRTMRLAFVLAGISWFFQLWLVGAAAPLARSIAAGSPLSQRGALRAAAVGLARGAVPHLCMFVALLVGLGALVLPGLIALALFSLAAASDERGLSASLVESAAIVRRHAGGVVALLATLVLVDIGIAVVAKLALTGPLPKKPDLAGFPAYRDLVRLVVAGAIVVAPLPISVLAAIHVRSTSAR